MWSGVLHQRPRAQGQSLITASHKCRYLESANLMSHKNWSMLWNRMIGLPLAQNPLRRGYLTTWHPYGSPGDCCRYHGDNPVHEQRLPPHWTSLSNQTCSCILSRLHHVNNKMSFYMETAQGENRWHKLWSIPCSISSRLPLCKYSYTNRRSLFLKEKPVMDMMFLWMTELTISISDVNSFSTSSEYFRIFTANSLPFVKQPL